MRLNAKASRTKRLRAGKVKSNIYTITVSVPATGQPVVGFKLVPPKPKRK
jgi:hypothetical protein